MKLQRMAMVAGLVLLALSASSLADTIYVNGATGDDAWDGLCETWDGGTCGPKATIQAGIDAAVDGDEVVVADGTYAGPGNSWVNFDGRALTLRSASGDPGLCIIEGSVLFSNGETLAAVIQSIRFHAVSDPIMYFDNCSATVNDCVFVGSLPDVDRQGVHGNRADPVFNGCFFVDCAAGYGGAIRFDTRSQPIFADCTFENNAATLGGGAVFLWASSIATFDRCIFWNNCTDEIGGAVVAAGSSDAILLQCVLVNNSAGGRAGAIHSHEDGSAYVVNSLIANNVSETTGGAMTTNGATAWFYNCTMTGNSADTGTFLTCEDGLFGTSYVEVSNCVVRNYGSEVLIENDSVVDINYTNITGGWPGVGNIDADPVFVDPDGPDNDPETWEDNDYRLAAGSPCIDAGGNDHVLPDYFDMDGDGDYDELTPIDMDGNPRLVDDPETEDTGQGTPPIVDMGAYEYQVVWLAGDMDCDGDVDFDDINPFVLAIQGQAGYEAAYPACVWLNGDINGDDVVDFDDIDPFVGEIGQG